ncbi:MAG: FeoB-associated Cys-rich membrane protein [Deltaproteobacteria bacterium]|nr:FeoB-associated Cys-rich membrane protein [Deltaproteobacteria bacterium]
MQETVVCFIVLAAVVYIVIKFYRNFSGKDKGCGGGCQSCGQKTTICQTIDDTPKRETTPPQADNQEKKSRNKAS